MIKTEDLYKDVYKEMYKIEDLYNVEYKKPNKLEIIRTIAGVTQVVLTFIILLVYLHIYHIGV